MSPSGTDPAPLLTVPSGSRDRDYPVYVGAGLLERIEELVTRHAPAHRYAVVSDSRVGPLWAEPVARRLRDSGRPVSLHTFPAGEAHKSRESWTGLTDEILAAGVGRDGAVIAVGGGVTGDLAGFVAATFMRGIPVVQVPTSLVAMIDASVGGKTGVDVPGGKNLVGAFHPPRAVVADPVVVETLPREERAQGLAEAVKHGAILDEAYLDRLGREGDDLLDGRAPAVEWAVKRSVELKGDVVGRDEREGGLRQILNFGHTLGHALEAASGYGVPHGTAVARGMVLEARVGEEVGVTEAGTADGLSEVLRRVGLDPGTPGPVEVDGILGWTRVDKKVRGGQVRYVLLREPGEVARAPDGGWSHAVDDAVVRRILGRVPDS